MKRVMEFLISRELWIGVVASLIATAIISIFNKIPMEGIKQIFTLDYLKGIFTQPIPLYVILISILFLTIVLFIIRIKRKPRFLKETTMKMGGFLWHWRWVYDKKEHDYDMADFLPLCPKCGRELRMGLGEHTHSCVNQHHYNIQRYFELKAQIKSTLRNNYPKEADKISVDQIIG